MPHENGCKKLHQRQIDGHMVRIETVSDISKDEEIFLALMCDLCTLYISQPAGSTLQQAIKQIMVPSLATIKHISKEIERQEREGDDYGREH